MVLRVGHLLGVSFRIALRDALIKDVSLMYADLYNMDFDGMYLPGIDLRFANLRGADFSGSDLSVANLSYAKVIGANFEDANLTRAIAIETYLGMACMGGASVNGMVT